MFSKSGDLDYPKQRCTSVRRCAHSHTQQVFGVDEGAPDIYTVLRIMRDLLNQPTLSFTWILTLFFVP
jgi:hypothetical protein